MAVRPSIFVVYVWHPPEGFRASARAVDREDVVEFVSPAALLRYLAGRGAVAARSITESPRGAADRGRKGGNGS
jgi:hypothetical protein